eukprot:CAMPEP_0183422972 /NCGR_PEP_ID=MMETSP0370-20130417/28158_1 /TAXON_ID=268820 /ORGANISM="Peridinium aciculiferum, Strain PAER-2" /LENGTH=174 /DNA_ID=CAMNT_0025607103 /DNA_START=162 /DNA_END=684 /DNA_ORIENTATION=-
MTHRAAPAAAHTAAPQRQAHPHEQLEEGSSIIAPAVLHMHLSLIAGGAAAANADLTANLPVISPMTLEITSAKAMSNRLSTSRKLATRMSSKSTSCTYKLPDMTIGKGAPSPMPVPSTKRLTSMDMQATSGSTPATTTSATAMGEPPRRAAEEFGREPTPLPAEASQLEPKWLE